MVELKTPKQNRLASLGECIELLAEEKNLSLVREGTKGLGGTVTSGSRCLVGFQGQIYLGCVKGICNWL